MHTINDTPRPRTSAEGTLTATAALGRAASSVLTAAQDVREALRLCPPGPEFVAIAEALADVYADVFPKAQSSRPVPSERPAP